jgi:LysR family transcriptional regulator of gallate degradation
MLPNLQHLRSFREVARHGSVSGAARAVHCSQPAVTQAIAGLEKQFDARLLIRRASGVALTAAGSLLLDRVERSLMRIREVLNGFPGGSAAATAELERVIRTRHLDVLGAVVEHGGFNAAARARNVTQPALNRAARELERLLGVALFETTSFGLTPTREARELARCVRLAFAEIDQARAELAALGGADSGRTVIGAMPLARSYLLPTALLEFTKRHPLHSVALIEGTYAHLLAALRSGEADILVGALREPLPASDVSQDHLFDDPLAIIVRARHPLTKRARPTVAALARYPWIAPRAGSPLRTHFDALWDATAAAAPVPTLECNSLAAARAFLLQSDRIMLLSAHQVHYELLAGQLVALPHPAGRVVRPIGITVRSSWRPTSTQQHLLADLRASARAAANLHATAPAQRRRARTQVR